MTETKESPVRFLGTYFDRDTVLKVARWAQILAWVGAGIYLITWLASCAQFALQFSSGAFYDKGMTLNPLDMFSNYSSYLLMPLPGVLYFFSLQGIAHGLLIFMDVEDNTRRAARGQ
jgi:hypothetical protein